MLNCLRRFGHRVQNNPALIGLGLYALSFLLICLYDPKLLSSLGLGKAFYDEEHYLRIALHGYREGSPAFHPLFPLLSAVFAQVIGLPVLLAARFLSLVLVAFSAILLFRLLLPFVSRAAAGWASLLYVINPFAVFHILAYTESLFSFLSLLMLTQASRFLEQGGRSRLALSGLFAGLLALTRPSLYPFIGVAVVFTALYLAFYPCTSEQRRRLFALLSTLIASSLAATATFFWHLLKVRGSFFASITAQKDWGRELGLYWKLFTSPRCLNGSNDLLTWELQAFYGPALMAVLMLVWNFRAKRAWASKPGRFSSIFLFWFSLLYAGFHCAIQFLTYERFYSLGRHVLSLPFFFIAVAFVLDGFRESPIKRRILWFYGFASFVYLCMFWVRLTKGSWIG